MPNGKTCPCGMYGQRYAKKISHVCGKPGRAKHEQLKTTGLYLLAQAMSDAGHPKAAIARSLGCSRQFVSHLLSNYRHGRKPPAGGQEQQHERSEC